MATTFITLVRLETRVASGYSAELSCEFLIEGMLSYFQALLRDDLDRTWHKFENRDTGVGYVTDLSSSDGTRVMGLKTFHYGTLISDDVWFSEPVVGGWGGFTARAPRYWAGDAFRQQSFGCSWSNWPVNRGVLAIAWDTRFRREIRVWLSRRQCRFDSRGRVVHFDHPDAVGPLIDFDASGGVNSGDEDSAIKLYYDKGPFVLYAGDSYYHPGVGMTGERASCGNVFWRWAVKIGISHAARLNLNVVGNLEGQDTVDLGAGGPLAARRSMDEYDLKWRDKSRHLGRLAWRGFPGECFYDRTNYETKKKGFPDFYNEVCFSPAQINLERLFRRSEFPDITTTPYEDAQVNLMLDPTLAHPLLAYRLGPDGVPADGSDRFRIGWRRDGATYYRFPSPENPMGDDRFFGVNEAIEHARPVDHPETSAIAANLPDAETWREVRPFATVWATDTILRGKVWPTEGPLPWRKADVKQGDWRHIDILKRVNINIIGAKGPEGLPDEDVELKKRWAAKRDRERDRLYFMLVAGMAFGEPDVGAMAHRHQACQFIASLADMVDRDSNETFYEAPDGSGIWALGYEKHPVINEASVYLTNANTMNYTPSEFRIELYNPMENIPWIPDADEEIDLREYVISIGPKAYRVGDMTRFGRNYATDRGPMEDEANRRLGAQGIYADPSDGTQQTWNRMTHIGFNDLKVGIGWPEGLSKADVEGRVEISLWKPLSDEELDGRPGQRVPMSLENVREWNVSGAVRRYIRVDTTTPIRLIPPYVPVGGGQTVFTGVYRRWDPLNARVYEPVKSNPETNDQCNVAWCPGWYPAKAATMAKPNVRYPKAAYTKPQNISTEFSNYDYEQHFTRNIKIVDGDLPSIGWLGEVIMHNCAQNGPITLVHAEAQQPTYDPYYPEYDPRNQNWDVDWQNEIDLKAKFDLFRPFIALAKPMYHPESKDCKTQNLQMLDIFTVWDPSNDGFDNDGDGAVDEEDTGCQAGDRCGPEVRVFGKVDLNLMHPLVNQVVMPDNRYARRGTHAFGFSFVEGRRPRGEGYSHASNWGPIETVGDILRADDMKWTPGWYLAGGGHSWQSGVAGYRIVEQGLTSFGGSSSSTAPGAWKGDDDGDAIFNERDERDMLFTWAVNYLTTRSNVFDIDLVVDLCEPPYYPERDGEQVRLPFPVCKTRRSHGRKRVLGVVDRSTCLRIDSHTGECDFTGPVNYRLKRFSDDRRVP